MKCILNEQSGIIHRVTNDEAERLAGKNGLSYYKYASKQAWKAQKAEKAANNG